MKTSNSKDLIAFRLSAVSAARCQTKAMRAGISASEYLRRLIDEDVLAEESESKLERVLAQLNETKSELLESKNALLLIGEHLAELEGHVAALSATTQNLLATTQNLSEQNHHISESLKAFEQVELQKMQILSVISQHMKSIEKMNESFFKQLFDGFVKLQSYIVFRFDELKGN